MRSTMRLIACSVFCICATGAAGVTYAQERKLTPLAVADVLGSLAIPNFPDSVSLSRDGRWVAYVLKDEHRCEATPAARYARIMRTGASRFFCGCDVWIKDVQSGEARRLTEGRGANWAPVWSPDGHNLAFLSDRSGAARLWIWEKASGQIRQVGNANVNQIYGLQWTPGGTLVIAKILREGMSSEDLLDFLGEGPREQPSALARREEPSVRVFDWRSQAVGQAQPTGSPESHSGYDVNLSDLAAIDIASGAARRIARNLRTFQYRVSPDGVHVAIISFGREASASQQVLCELRIVSLKQGEPRLVARDIPNQIGAPLSWSPDSSLVAYQTSGPQAKGDVFVVSFTGGEPRNLTPNSHPPLQTTALLWDSAGQSLYSLSGDALWKISAVSGGVMKVAEVPRHNITGLVAQRNQGRLWPPNAGESAIVFTRDKETIEEGIFKIDLASGGTVKLLEENKSHPPNPARTIDVSDDGQTLVYLAEDAQHGLDIWAAGADLRNPRQVTNINPQFGRYVFGTSRLIRWRSDDGEELKGALFLPAEYEEGKRYPLITLVYGGDFLSQSLNHFNGWGAGLYNPQLFATRGYAMLLPDAPQRHLGMPMLDLAKTVLPGVQKVIDLGLADPERLGVMGHSYGGYSTLALIVQSPVFKAAVVSDGIFNLTSAYQRAGAGGGHIGWVEEGQAKMGGSVWQHRNRYIENSPFFFLDRVQTPVLILHGDLDTTASPIDAQMGFESLRRLGKEVVYAAYTGETHVPASYANQLDYVNRIISWFDEHFK